MAPPNQTDCCGGSSESVATTVDVAAARELISPAGGHRYLDVRTEEELSKLGHLVEVDSSTNVPYMFITPQAGSRVKNPQFVEQVASLFTKDEQVVVVRPLILINLHDIYVYIFSPTAIKCNANTSAGLPKRQEIGASMH
ncbi:unnamed protein product [Urochloa humidicola]